MPATQRLLLRLNPTSSEYKDVFRRYDSIRAGYNGECNVDRHLSKLSPTPQLIVLQDITIQINPHWFIQIDTLIITNRYILILEIKSYRGILHFEEEPHALIQINDENSFVRRCPQLQALSYVEGLQEWLNRHGFNLPVYANIVLGFPTAQVKTAPKLIKLIQAEQVPFRIRELNRTSPTVMSDENVRLLANLLKASNDPYKAFPLGEYYKLDPDLIRTGVICRKCGAQLYKQSQATWCCDSCFIVVEEAPLRAIEDWLILMKTTISNEECRNWLGLKDKYAAHYLLSKSKLEAIGNSKARKYRFSSVYFYEDLQQ